MKTMYTRVYSTLDSNLSEYNVGARKGKTSLINVFILNAIINQTLRSKKPEQIEVVILDYKQHFDTLNLHSGLVELYNLGMKGSELNILYQANKIINMAVKSEGEIGEYTHIPEVWMQGDTFAPMAATAEMDSIAAEWLRTGNDAIYKYKGVDVGSLGMIDDTVTITNTGPHTTQVNAFVNVKSAEKGLMFGLKKCVILHVSSKGLRTLSNLIVGKRNMLKTK